MNPTALLLGLLLAAGAAPAAWAADAAPDGGVDWLLREAARAFTSESSYFGQVHLPVIASNPNSGITYGVLPVWLKHDERGGIVQIFAPMFTYNRVYGAAFSGSYYYYPSEDEKLRIILEKSQRSNQRAAFEYDDLALFDGRATLRTYINLEADGSVEFYGVGPGSTKGDEASERLLEDLGTAEFGLKFWDVYSAAGGWTLRRTDVQNGPFSAPTTLEPGLLSPTSYSLPRATLTRDTRDLPFTPSRGSLSELFAEYSCKTLASSADYEHYGGQWRRYDPVADDLVAVLHAQGEWSGGGSVPFTALSALGGPNTLRGFAEGRFQDRGSAFANAEARWRVHSIEMAGSPTEFQIAPFLDEGTVFPSPGKARSRDLETVVGVAFRAVVKPSVVGNVQVGVSREGPAVFVGIDYPF